MCPYEPCVASILMFPFKSKDVWLTSSARLIDVLSEKKDIYVSPLSLKGLSMWENEKHIQEGCQ